MAKRSRSEAVSASVVRALKAVRIEQKRSIYWVSQHSGLTQQSISYVERGLRTPAFDTVIRMALALDADLGTLVANAIAETERD